MRKAQYGLLAHDGGPPLGVLRLVASAASAGAALVGLVTLVAWAAGLSLGGPDLTIKPVTALAVLLIACAMLPQFPLGPPGRIACGAIAALLAASSLIQEFGSAEFRSWLAPAVAPGPTPGDFRMPPATALAVLLAGTATALLPISRLRDAARFLAVGAAVIGTTALLGHLVGVDISSVLPLSSVALPTVAALIAICVALLIHGQLSSPARAGDFRLFLSQFFAPLLIFTLFAGWSWRNVEADARASAERTAASFSEYAQRTFEIQETALEAVLDHVKGRSAASIAANPAVHEFMAQIDRHTHTSEAISLVRSDTGRVIASSQGFPAPDLDISQRDYLKAHRAGYQNTYIGEVVSAAPFGSIGFTISRSDPATGVIAVAQMSIDSFMRPAEGRASPHDALMLARADGMALVLSPPVANPIGYRLHDDGVTMRLIDD
jgi:hypothetical protein